MIHRNSDGHRRHARLNLVVLAQDFFQNGPLRLDAVSTPTY